MSTRRPSSVRLLMTTVLLLVFAVSGMVGANSPTEISFWHALGSDHQTVLNELVQQFNEANPDIHVEPQYVGNYGALQQNLVAAVAANRPPNVSLVYNNWTAAFIEGEAIVPVASFVDHPEYGLTNEEKADYVPAFIEANSWDGVWTTIPFNKSIYVLYYNADLLEQAGVEVPQTMDELREAARKVAETTDAKGLVIQANNDQFGIFLHAFGGSWLGADGMSAFNDEVGVQALEFMQDLIHVDQSTYYYDGYLEEELNQGNAAMFFATVATIPWVSNNLNWGAAPVPGTEDDQAAVVQGTDLAIFKGASDETEQLAAWRFVKWLTSTEPNTHWAIQSGYLPVTSSAANSEAYQAHVASDPLKYEAGVSQLANAKFDPGVSAWTHARDAISFAVQRALIERTSAQTVLDEAVAEINLGLSY